MQRTKAVQTIPIERFAGEHVLPSNKQAAIVQEKKGPIDTTYLGMVVILLLVGLFALYSSSYPFSYNKFGDAQHLIKEQIVGLILGVITVLVFFVASYVFNVLFKNNKNKWLKLICNAFLALSFLFLVMVLGTKGYNGAKRWLDFGIIFQPSELAKLAIILSFALLISEKKGKLNNFKSNIPFYLIMGSMGLLLILEPHLSCTILIVGIGIFMMYTGGSNVVQLGLFIITCILILVLLVVFFQGTALDYVKSRIETWLDPFNSPHAGAYQVRQSIITVGSGGLFGHGIGKSVQKFFFLPEMHNDYIFAVRCEEMGFVGALFLVIMFTILFLRGLYIAARVKNTFAKMIVLGINVQIILQAFLHIAVNINLIPSTGISLPFISSGRSSLVLLIFEVGLVLYFSRSADLSIDKPLISNNNNIN